MFQGKTRYQRPISVSHGTATSSESSNYGCTITVTESRTMRMSHVKARTFLSSEVG